MTLPEARRVFGALMKKARTGQLTERDQLQLTQARQTLRRSKRPAMNPRQSKYVVGDTVYINRSQVAPSLAKDLFWRVFIDPAVIREISKDKTRVKVEFPFGKSYWFDVDAIEFKNPSRRKPTLEKQVSRRLQHFGYSKRDAEREAANAQGSNVEEIVKRIVRRDTHKSVGGHLNPRRRRLDPVGERQRRGMAVNPSRSRMVRIGRALEVRYKRDIGRKPGYYKHEIRSRKAGVYTIPPGWVYVSSKSVLITEGEPRV